MKTVKEALAPRGMDSSRRDEDLRAGKAMEGMVAGPEGPPCLTLRERLGGDFWVELLLLLLIVGLMLWP